MKKYIEGMGEGCEGILRVMGERRGGQMLESKNEKQKTKKTKQEEEVEEEWGKHRPSDAGYTKTGVCRENKSQKKTKTKKTNG